MPAPNAGGLYKTCDQCKTPGLGNGLTAARDSDKPVKCVEYVCQQMQPGRISSSVVTKQNPNQAQSRPSL